MQGTCGQRFVKEIAGTRFRTLLTERYIGHHSRSALAFLVCSSLGNQI